MSYVRRPGLRSIDAPYFCIGLVSVHSRVSVCLCAVPGLQCILIGVCSVHPQMPGLCLLQRACASYLLQMPCSSLCEGLLESSLYYERSMAGGQSLKWFREMEHKETKCVKQCVLYLC